MVPREPKPAPGYIGAPTHYGDGYDVRLRAVDYKKSRSPANRWAPKLRWDVFHWNVRVVEATSLRLAEEYIARDRKRRSDK